MEKGRRTQVFVWLAVSVSCMTVGVALSWITPVVPKFHSNETGINITEQEISWVVAISSPGYMTGSLLSRFTSDRFGRRATILLSVIPMVAGTIMILSTTSVWMICLTKFLWGLGSGVAGSVTSIYIAEISDKEIRGTLTSGTRFILRFGSFFVMCIGSFVSYQTLSYTMLVLPICYFVACWFIPETPYFLLNKGKVDDARDSLRTLTGGGDEKVLEDKLSVLRSDVRKETVRSSSAIELFTGKEYRKALIISIGLKLAQMMSGSIAIAQYFGRIIQESESSIHLGTAIIVFGAARFIVGIYSSALMDKVGRRPILIYSFALSSFTLSFLGLYYFIQPSSPDYAIIPFVGLIIYTLATTYDSVVYVLPAELFPMNVKTIAMTFVNLSGGLLNFVCVKGYQEIKDLGGMAAVFWFYAVVAMAGAIFSYILVPETKGKSLGEIQTMLLGTTDEAAVKLNEVKEEGVKKATGQNETEHK